MGISTHVLDTAIGRPAAGVAVRLERAGASGDWSDVCVAVTDADGRVAPLVADDDLESGSFRLTFASGAYFSERGEAAFHPEVRIEFDVRDRSEHYHVPLLVSAWSYSTYRGS